MELTWTISLGSLRAPTTNTGTTSRRFATRINKKRVSSYKSIGSERFTDPGSSNLNRYIRRCPPGFEQLGNAVHQVSVVALEVLGALQAFEASRLSNSLKLKTKFLESYLTNSTRPISPRVSKIYPTKGIGYHPRVSSVSAYADIDLSSHLIRDIEETVRGRRTLTKGARKRSTKPLGRKPRSKIAYHTIAYII